MLLLMKDGVNLFKKEDQKYNLISYTNEEELTLKEVLLDKLNFSVRSISKMKREQSVFVNGVFKKQSTKLKKGDLIEVKIEEEMANFEPQNLNLNILYDYRLSKYTDADMVSIHSRIEYMISQILSSNSIKYCRNLRSLLASIYASSSLFISSSNGLAYFFNTANS